jgi:hypothetical protein
VADSVEKVAEQYPAITESPKASGPRDKLAYGVASLIRVTYQCTHYGLHSVALHITGVELWRERYCWQTFSTKSTEAV